MCGTLHSRFVAINFTNTPQPCRVQQSCSSLWLLAGAGRNFCVILPNVERRFLPNVERRFLHAYTVGVTLAVFPHHYSSLVVCALKEVATASKRCCLFFVTSESIHGLLSVALTLLVLMLV